MFFLLIVPSFSTWWEYDESTFQEKVKNSLDMPIFALCYSPYCPHCHGLPEGLKKYSEGLGNRTDFLITSINCQVSYGCRHFHIPGTPVMALVIGSNWRYWPITGERGPEGWDRWINETIRANLREVKDDNELNVAKLEPKDGGSTFYLEVGDENHPFIDSLRNYSRYFRIFNDSFVYRINKNLTEPKLVAYRTPHCTKEFKGSITDLEKFFEANKYGLYHRYDYNEFAHLSSREKVAIYVNEGGITNAQRNGLMKLSQHYCDKVTFGWTNIDDEKQILKLSKKQKVDVPFLYVVDRKIRCERVWMKKLLSAHYELFPSILKGDCYGTMKTTKSNIPKDRLTIVFAVAGVIVGLIVSALSVVPLKTLRTMLK